MHQQNTTPDSRRDLLLDSLESRQLFDAASAAMLGAEFAVDFNSTRDAFEPVHSSDVVHAAADASAEDTAKFSRGDVNRDHAIDARDIDLLGQMVHSENAPLDVASFAQFDLNSDGSIDGNDIDFLIHDILGVEYGDANLDGRVDGADATIMFSNMFASGGWADGDFNCDGTVDGQDMILWNSNKNFFSTPDSIAARSQTLLGDFNFDGAVNADDIDMLNQEVHGAAPSDDMYDLTGDGTVDRADVDAMIHKVIGTEYGDANLDGLVDADDAGIMFGNMFSDATGWAAGDFTGDGVVDGMDMIVWNDHKQIAPLAAASQTNVDATTDPSSDESEPAVVGSTPFERMDGASNHDLLLKSKRVKQVSEDEGFKKLKRGL